MGLDASLSGESFLRVYMPDNWVEHRLLRLFHGLPSAKQRSFRVSSLYSTPSIYSVRNYSEKWGIPRLELSTYLRFCSLLCFGVTFWLTFFETEVTIREASCSEIDDKMTRFLGQGIIRRVRNDCFIRLQNHMEHLQAQA
jgi:hypothetical protein